MKKTFALLCLILSCFICARAATATSHSAPPAGPRKPAPPDLLTGNPAAAAPAADYNPFARRGPQPPVQAVEDVISIGQMTLSAKLLSVFNQVQQFYAPDENGKFWPLPYPSGFKPMSPDGQLAAPVSPRGTTITGIVEQKISDTDYILAPVPLRSPGFHFELKLLKAQDWMVGKGGIFSGLREKDTVLPDGNNLQHYIEVPDYPEATEEQFVNALKAGQQFKIQLAEMRKPIPSVGLTPATTQPVRTLVNYTVKWN